MFAILLNKSMDPFYANISSFPTAIFTVMLGVSVLYWAGAVLGLVDLDVVDIDPGFDLNADSGHTPSDVLSALLLRTGLVGVPLVVTLSLISLIGWILSYYLAHFILGNSSGLMRFLLGLPIFAVSLIAAAWITSKAIQPLKPLFRSATAEHFKHILGQRAIVRTSRVDENFGEATLDDGGAGLILKIRSHDGETLEKGDRVVYRVISEEKYSKM